MELKQRVARYQFAMAMARNMLAKGLITCNELNAKYRWVKFYLDKDKDVCVSLDAYIDEHTVGEECLNLVRRMINISDEAYPLFMKALWA